MDKKYDLEERLLSFAIKNRDYIKNLPRNITNKVYADQLARSSSSPGANYIEANESLSKKDFCMRIKICRKEAKETHYWLQLIDNGNDDKLMKKCLELQHESMEYVKIFSAILVHST